MCVVSFFSGVSIGPPLLWVPTLAEQETPVAAAIEVAKSSEHHTANWPTFAELNLGYQANYDFILFQEGSSQSGLPCFVESFSLSSLLGSGCIHSCPHSIPLSSTSQSMNGDLNLSGLIDSRAHLTPS